jgi:hypothetical protein
MPAPTEPPAPDYPTLLAAARLAALHTLADILLTSDDTAERRRAATTILRLPDPPDPSIRAEGRKPSVPSTREPSPTPPHPADRRERTLDSPDEHDSNPQGGIEQVFPHTRSSPASTIAASAGTCPPA